MAAGQVNILDGNTFVVSDTRGDIDASPEDTTGLFSNDTRFLSRWILTVDGRRLEPLSVDDLQYYESRFFLAEATSSVYVNASLSVLRRRAVGMGFHEELTLLNHADAPVDLQVRIEAGSDFADLFEVKEKVRKKGRCYHRIDRDQLVIGYERGTFRRETVITSSQPAEFDEHGVTMKVHIGAHGQWSTDLDVVTALLGWGTRNTKPKYGHAGDRPRPMADDLRRWIDGAPRLETDREGLGSTYRRSLVDLAALRFSPPITGGSSLPAAALPWFMAIFGRDSIITSLQALPFIPELAKTTLLALGAWQGTDIDDCREEEPGRILHEMRYGETAAFEEQPHSPYYGTADATARPTHRPRRVSIDTKLPEMPPGHP